MTYSFPLIIALGWAIGLIVFILLVYFVPRIINARSYSQQQLLSRLSQAAQMAQRGRTVHEIFELLSQEVSPIGYMLHFLNLTPDREHLKISYLNIDKELIKIAERITGVLVGDFLIELVPDSLLKSVLYDSEPRFINQPDKVIREIIPPLALSYALTLIEKLQIKNLAIVAIKSGSDVRGLLIINGPKLSRTDLPAIQIFANQVGVALENVALYLELAERASALQNERNFIDAVFDASGVLVMVLNLDGAITRVNKACEKLTGYSTFELAGQIFWDRLVQEDNATNTKSVFEELTAGYFPNVFENTIITKDGARRLISWNNTAITDAEGKASFIICAGTDITQRKKMEENLRLAESKYRTLIEKIPASIYMVALDGTATMLYNSFKIELNLGLSPAAWDKNSSDWTECIHLEDRARVVGSFLNSLKTAKPFHAEYRLVTKDNSLIWVNDQADIIVDENNIPLYMQGIMTDITPLKKAEEDLRSHHEHLEELVQDRTIELKTTNQKLAHTLDELTRSNTELEQFAYIASHDLQEPLRMIASYTQLLARRYQGQLDADADDFIHFAVDGTIRMQHLINDLLTYSRISTRGKEFHMTDLNQVIADVLKNLQVAIEENHAVINVGGLPKILADEVQMIQLFQNLIGNAIKFHGSQSPEVTINAEYNQDHWKLTIHDNGIGISPKYHDRIFEIFQRLHGRAEYPGTGIGLAICKKIVNRHGGEIWVESAEDSGATFLFTIPTLSSAEL